MNHHISGIVSEMPLYLSMPSSYAIADVGAESVVIKSSGNEKMRATVMLLKLADSTKLPPSVMVYQKNSKAQLLVELIITCLTFKRRKTEYSVV
jgi:hypothetical protein